MITGLMGIQYSSKIGYDAKEMADFFQTLERKSEGSESAAPDLNQFLPIFQRTMEGFSILTYQAKINKKPERIRIKNTSKTTTLEQAFRNYNGPADRYNELAILNGM